MDHENTSKLVLYTKPFSRAMVFDLQRDALSRQLNHRIVRRDRRVIPGVIKRSVIAEWTVPLRIAIGLQHQIPNLYPGKIVFSESVGYCFEGPVLCRQESAPAVTAISFAPRFNHAFLRTDSDRVAT